MKLDAKLTMLIEVKAIGSELKDAHVKQAVDYASNQGCEWVVLTNAIEWRLYKVLFRKPIDKQEIAHFDLLTAKPKDDDDLEKDLPVDPRGLHEELAEGVQRPQGRDESAHAGRRHPQL